MTADPVRRFLAQAGAKGGRSTSAAKRASSARNGSKGGRPPAKLIKISDRV
jgi:hypothetical protein